MDGLRVGGVLTGRADQVHVQVVEERLEIASGEALVGQDDLPSLHEVVVNFQQGGHHLPFAELRIRQAPGDRHPFGGGDQVQAHTRPEIAGMRGAIALSGVSGQIRTLRGLP